MSDAGYRWMPATAAQKSALDSEADILLFGGSAGSLKTETMLMDAVQEYQNPNLRAIIFRSSFVEMTDIIDKTRRLYAPLGGVFVGPPRYTWTFPSGATIRFAYMKNDDDVPQIFSAVLLMPGQSFRLPFSTASTYSFACTAHASGQMTVTVEPAPDF